MRHPPTTAKNALDAVARLKPLIDRLPEAVEVRDGLGHITYKVRKKSFVIIGQGYNDEGSLSIKSDKATQQFLIEHRGFIRTPYIGQHGWVSVAEMPPTEWGEIEGLVIDAYRMAAPKTLVKALDAELDG